MAERNTVVPVEDLQENRAHRFACSSGVLHPYHVSLLFVRLSAPCLASRQSTFALSRDAGHPDSQMFSRHL